MKTYGLIFQQWEGHLSGEAPWLPELKGPDGL